MIFKSRQVNLDPKPHKDAYGERHRYANEQPWTRFDPRPEFEPTRDPRPYRNRCDGSRWPDNGGDPDLLPFTPRRKQYDTPVNPILVEFRNTLPNAIGTTSSLAAHWTSSDEMWRQMCLSDHHDEAVPVGTPEHEAHARKVLTRLARLSESSSS